VERAAVLIIALLPLRSPGHVRLPFSLILSFAEFANVEQVVPHGGAHVIGRAICSCQLIQPEWASFGRPRPAELFLGHIRARVQGITHASHP
jgi:hypothetical protein